MLNLEYGYVTNIDELGRVKVMLPAKDNFVTDFLTTPKAKSRYDKDGSFFDINEEVAVLFDDEKGDGTVLHAINSDTSPLIIKDRNKKYFTFLDQTHFEYDRAQHKALADLKGTLDIKTLKTTHIGDLYVEGNIICAKDITDKKSSMQAMRDVHNSHTHPNGNNGSPTGTPQSKM